MTVGIVGLGLDRRLVCKGVSRCRLDRCTAMMRTQACSAFAQLADAVNAPLTMENIGTCDLGASVRAAACRDRLSAF